MNTDGTPPGPETTRRHPRAERPHPPQGPTGTGTPDPARVTVEDGHLGAPFSLLRTDQAISWKVHLRAEHILRGTCPVPPELADRDLAAADIRADSAEGLLLITLRELGYLDEDGRALLPWPALVRGTAERASLADRAGAGEASPPRIEDAIRRLLARGLLTWETRVELLCHTPTVQEAEPEEPATASAHAPGAPSAHRVAGHLMRIGHLGKEAGPEARAAYRDDHRRAGLAGPHELPHGYTYVREHERGT
ncbi:hypothetical protein [Streptomyces sp. NRRL S-31]|uniref:hypothetical protein n=1 Tax=Streptomyces sp. NRRL S-31 TaxID=1463898 RepID=UPI0004CA4E9B|nr:hypothetical protein [Streptomyces sp. NRRL S-31]